MTIDGPDAHHLANVMRAQPGEQVWLFDGRGKEFVAQIEEITKKTVLLRIIDSQDTGRELDHQLTLAVALPKGDRQKVLVEKLVELGVSNLLPLNTRRSVVVANAKSTEKLQRRVIEASKQCGRNQLMEIGQPTSFQTLIEQKAPARCRIIGHPNSTPVDSIDVDVAQDVLVAIGPEGGFTDDEIELARSYGWQVATMGKTVLRVETAAVAAATIFGIGRKMLNSK